MRRIQPVDIPGGTFHVANRGNRKGRIYEDDHDRVMFDRILAEVKEEYDVDVRCEAQLFTHFHAVVTTPRGNLSDFMERWEGRYAQYYNWRHNRVGHLFQGPFRCTIVEHDLHLFIAVAYLFNNPIESGLVSKPEDWKWSTYAANVGLRRPPAFLSTSWVETLLPTSSLTESQALLRRCMSHARPIEAYLEAVNSDCDVSLRSYISARLKELEQPCSYQKLTRPPLEHLLRKEMTRAELAEAIRVAHETYGYKLKDIAPYAELQPANVSRIYRVHRRAIESSTSRRIQLAANLLDFDSPADADLELRHESAATDAKLCEETVVVLEPKQITAAGVDLARSLIETGDLRDGDDRSAALKQRPPGSAKLKLGDQVDVDRPKPQPIAETAVDPGTEPKTPADIG